MAYVTKSELELAIEVNEERQRMEMALEGERERREHQLKLAKYKALQPRYKSIERALVVFAKAPALVIAVVCVTVLAARGKEVPEILNKFLTI